MRSIQDVRMSESLLYAGVVAALLVAAGLLDEGAGRVWFFGGAVAAGVLAFVAAAPRRVSMKSGVLYVRERGRSRSIRLAEVVEVLLPFDPKKGPSLFLRRADGSGVTILRLDTGTASFRAELGRELLLANPRARISNEARPYLGLRDGL